MPNAAVLPEPVCDCPTMSRPCISNGMDSAWMGDACSKPSLSMALSNSSDRPSSVNSFGVMSCSRDANILTGPPRKGTEIYQPPAGCASAALGEIPAIPLQQCREIVLEQIKHCTHAACLPGPESANVRITVQTDIDALEK